MRIIDRRHHAERNLELEAEVLLDELAEQAIMLPCITSVRNHYTRTPGEFIKHLRREQREVLEHLKSDGPRDLSPLWSAGRAVTPIGMRPPQSSIL